MSEEVRPSRRRRSSLYDLNISGNFRRGVYGHGMCDRCGFLASFDSVVVASFLGHALPYRARPRGGRRVPEARVPAGGGLAARVLPAVVAASAARLPPRHAEQHPTPPEAARRRLAADPAAAAGGETHRARPLRSHSLPAMRPPPPQPRRPPPTPLSLRSRMLQYIRVTFLFGHETLDTPAQPSPSLVVGGLVQLRTWGRWGHAPPVGAIAILYLQLLAADFLLCSLHVARYVRRGAPLKYQDWSGLQKSANFNLFYL
ncbi:unnamed protein product [Leptidea sinapis]|uniref:Uncharacterized protein n=1 Tax=Leptidea sinapis TaxID=189913 RepID=A0A5E4QSQ3_9NEOP|nr:unnamed protein product [Leptidea sinapis]